MGPQATTKPIESIMPGLAQDLVATGVLELAFTGKNGRFAVYRVMTTGVTPPVANATGRLRP